MRRAVGAEEEFRVARGGGFDQRLAVLLALEHRQAIVVRTNAAEEQRVAVQQQVVRGDRRGDVVSRDFHVLHRLARGDVLQHYLEIAEARNHRAEDLFDEGLLAVEDVDVRVGGFAVHQQRQAELLHLLQRVEAARQARGPRFGVGGRARRIELHAEYAPRELGGAISSGGVSSVR